MRPYEHDLAFLHEELEHHEYIAKKYTQEYDKDLAREFTKICSDIRLSIQAVEKKQEAAISEWSALTRSEREALLLPIYNTAEETVAKISDAGCPEFSRYLDNLFTDFLIDLVEFKEYKKVSSTPQPPNPHSWGNQGFLFVTFSCIIVL